MVYGFIGISLYLYVKCCVDYKWVISTDTFFLRRHTEILGLIAKCINGLDGYRILHNKNKCYYKFLERIDSKNFFASPAICRFIKRAQDRISAEKKIIFVLFVKPLNLNSAT